MGTAPETGDCDQAGRRVPLAMPAPHGLRHGGMRLAGGRAPLLCSRMSLSPPAPTGQLHGPVGDPLPPEPGRARPRGAAPWGQDAPVEARAFATGEAAAAGLRQGMSIGTVLTVSHIALNRASGTASAISSALSWAVRLAAEVDAAALSDDPIGAVSDMCGRGLEHFGCIVRLALPRALVYVFERLFPRLASGAAARTPAERAVARVARSPLVLKALYHLPGFATRAMSLGSEPVAGFAPDTRGESSLANLSPYESGIGIAEDAGKRYVDSMYGVTVASDPPEAERRGAHGSPPARGRGRAPARRLDEPPPTRVSCTLDAVRAFLIIRCILALVRLADKHVTQELVAHALQLALDMLALFAG